MRCQVAPRLVLTALEGLGPIEPGAALPARIREGLTRAGLSLEPGDVLVVASKLVSRAEGRYVDLASVVPSAEARDLAAAVSVDPRLVALILAESRAISRKKPGVLVTRHRLGHVGANAGVDLSNAREGAALLLPEDPDASARALRDTLHPEIGVVISDSLGRPFRLGSVGVAIGLAGLPALDPHEGRVDLRGRPLAHTLVAIADGVAAAADLVNGQADEARGVVHVRGLRFAPRDDPASAAQRPEAEDLYA